VRELLAITKALSDETRVRVLAALREGELCLCHVVGLLELAPSTVSKHLDVLCQARLVERRKDGRWAYFRLAGREAPAAVRQVLRWVIEALAEDATVARDAKRLEGLRGCDLKNLAACYKSWERTS
jgi:ArsR family transcriptional regulator, arsenate/arsenite/antimonite-responsive transcriptional repressor